MGDGHAVDREIGVELRGDFADFLDGHGFVSLVLEIQSGTIVGVVADAAVESHNGTNFGCANMADQRQCINGIADEDKEAGV
jgi:hypothetical protein